MKKTIFFTILTVASMSINAQAPSVKILKYSDHEPLGGMRTRFIKEVFFPAIEKESNGRLKIEDHWGSELATGYDALRVTGKEGKADMSIVVPEYVANNLPLHQIFKSFPKGPTGDKQVEFFQQVYKKIPAFAEELEKENVVNVFFATGFPVAFLSTKPLNNLQDIKGEKWRSASFWHKDFLQNAGAIPVTMPWGKGVYDALKEGTLDGLMVNIDSGHDINAHEVAPNVVASKELWLGHVYLLVMNKNTWDNLAKEDQQAIQRAAKTAYKSLGTVMDNGFDTMVKDMKNDGVNIRILESKEVDKWQTAVKYKEVQATWAKEQEKKNIKDVTSILQKVTKLINHAIK